MNGDLQGKELIPSSDGPDLDGGPIRDASTERRSSPDVWAFGRLSRCPDIWSIGVDWLSDSLLTPSQMLVRLVVNVTALDNCREDKSRDEDRSADERTCACISHACACFLPCPLSCLLPPLSLDMHARPRIHARASHAHARPSASHAHARPPASHARARTPASHARARTHARNRNRTHAVARTIARTQPQSHARTHAR